MKTKIKLIVAMFIIGVSVVGCMKEPMACATIPATGTTGTAVTFNSDCSMDAHHYEWNFGDGSMSTDANTTHTYTTAGMYTVTLTTMSENEKKMDETSGMITIN